MYKCFIGQECGLSKLNQFLDMKCEVSFNFHTHNNNFMGTYVYNCFNYKEEESAMFIFDSNDETLNTRLEKNIIQKIYNLRDDDLYNDVVSIYTDDFIISITTLEQKLSIPECDKCGHVFEEDQQIWRINQIGNFGSVHDSETINKKLCDCCVSILMDKDIDWSESYV